eukprot:scaffold490_cov323-Prasinococcus_capsulatus_cf.AAC.2
MTPGSSMTPNRREEMYAAVWHLREHCLFDVRCPSASIARVCGRASPCRPVGPACPGRAVARLHAERQVACGVPGGATGGGAAAAAAEREPAGTDAQRARAAAGAGGGAGEELHRREGVPPRGGRAGGRGGGQGALPEGSQPTARRRPLRAAPHRGGGRCRCWAKYQAGEKRKVEEAVERGGPLSKSSDNDNPELAAIEAELGGEGALVVGGTATTAAGDAAAAGAGGSGSGNGSGSGGATVGESVSVALCQYLYGVVLLQLGRKGEARRAMVDSVNAFPLNWAAWSSLQKACDHKAHALSLQLRSHWMSKFFFASVCLEFQHNLESLQRYDELLQSFPASCFIIGQAATAHYNRRAFDEAQELFEKLLKEDPYRIEGQDTYSNILYVKEAFAQLSYLAHKAALTDKYRPETCCVIGNYYSLKGHHEKAVLYFKRALKLNREYLSAWTLMGHEYVEMKNTSAAIEAYRRAVDISPRDYRAWYGLGQTYEILAMPYYALYYYRRATQLRPMDARMWAAMGQCYEHDQLRNLQSAVRCYHRYRPAPPTARRYRAAPRGAAPALGARLV